MRLSICFCGLYWLIYVSQGCVVVLLCASFYMFLWVVLVDICVTGMCGSIAMCVFLDDSMSFIG